MSDLEQQVVAYAQTASAGLRATQQESDPFTFTKEEEAEFSHQRQLQEATSGEIVQPNENGEFPTPADGAIWMAATFGIPQTPLKGKKPFLPGWQLNGSTDPAQIREWTTEYPECNFGSVAVSGKHFIFEADSTAVRERFKTQNPDHDFTSRLIIESSPGKGHRYYLSAPGVENVG